MLTSEDNIIGERLMTSNLAIKATSFPLTAYPTYADYITIMNGFATNNPSMRKVENIGATTEEEKENNQRERKCKNNIQDTQVDCQKKSWLVV